MMRRDACSLDMERDHSHRAASGIGTACALTAGVLWLYAGILWSLARQWAADENYSHGFFVLPLAGFFVWERREALRRAPSRPSLIGALIIVLSLMLLVAGLLGSELFLSRVSLIGVLAGIALFVLGRDHFRLLAFPIAFLVLMIPLPAILFNRIAFPLQLLASRAGETAIAGAGIPILREGNVLQLPTRALEVAEACSGIRSLVSLVMLGIVLGYFTEQRTSTRVLIAMAAVPIAIIANAIRVAGTGLASELVSPAAADGFFHTFSGWLVFVVAFAGLMAFQRAIGTRHAASAPVADAGRPSGALSEQPPAATEAR
jgi:exosortase